MRRRMHGTCRRRTHPASGQGPVGSRYLTGTSSRGSVRCTDGHQCRGPGQRGGRGAARGIGLPQMCLLVPLGDYSQPGPVRRLRHRAAAPRDSAQGAATGAFVGPRRGRASSGLKSTYILFALVLYIECPRRGCGAGGCAVRLSCQTTVPVQVGLPCAAFSGHPISRVLT